MALQKKPPVVTIMGHVDHGKTTLLDYIRKTKLAAKEVGEITQATSAYQIKVGEEKITFIDTPGHQAFSQMRSRGAQIADTVVLVVAANDGVMDQTKESIRIIKEANVPFLVAVNKIDLPDASIDKVKTQLAESEVFVEGFGGNTVTVPISAKTGEGVDALLEMILLTAELENLQADPEGDFEGFVVESKADKLRGSLVSLIVKNGTLRKGDEIESEGIFAKVKMLSDEWGKPKEQAFPADPVQVLGFSSLPQVGAIVTLAGKPSTVAAKIIEKRAIWKKSEDKEVINIILKADVSGSLEAVLTNLPAKIVVVEKSVGEITESDVLLAKTLGAEIFGFNVPISSDVKKLAETEKVKVQTYKIIYDLFKELEDLVSGRRESKPNRRILGKAEILAVFEMKGDKIAGAKVLEGKINKNALILLKRGETELGETRIASLKEQKQDINEASLNKEFGAVFTHKLDFQKGDVVISYSLE